jgi:oxygen-independent coproporphyrinogen III oxidase
LIYISGRGGARLVAAEHHQWRNNVATLDLSQCAASAAGVCCAMIPIMTARAGQTVPRYTSYPTAPHFTPRINDATFADWLARINTDDRLSLYVHVPFCRRLCHYCGCTTTITSRYEPIAGFIDALKAEIDLVASKISRSPTISNLHFGGGTPTILTADDFVRLRDDLAARFSLTTDTDFAVEIDPRTLDESRVAALARCGVTRVSLGVQDFDYDVQRAINRTQPYEVVRTAVERLRDAGIEHINFDLIYGLPQQTCATIQATIDKVAMLAPNRVALFGYAHVPYMKRHQKLLELYGLPDAAARVGLASTAQRRLQDHGYVWIGIDHFALPADPLSRASANGTLHRNFQGYTTDDAEVLIGLGPSAISTTRHGYAQSTADLPAWSDAVAAGRLATCRGIVLNDDDRLRRKLIERLMCDLAVDVDAESRRFGVDAGSYFRAEWESLAALEAEGLVTVQDRVVRVTPEGRMLVRSVATTFDQYFRTAIYRHSAAV